MTAATFVLHRYEDKSGVSGTGFVAEGCEFSDGSVALHWPGEHPSTATWQDIRGVEAVHGHSGLTIVEYCDPKRLVAAYKQLMFWMLRARDDDRPMSVEPHPDWPDRLLCMFRDEKTWRMWLALLDGSTYTATHVADGNDIKHTWISPDGGIWLTYTTPADDEDPLAIFDREDR